MLKVHLKSSVFTAFKKDGKYDANPDSDGVIETDGRKERDGGLMKHCLKYRNKE